MQTGTASGIFLSAREQGQKANAPQVKRIEQIKEIFGKGGAWAAGAVIARDERQGKHEQGSQN